MPPAESAESLLTCEDIDWTLHASSTETALAWRCEFDVNLMRDQGIPQSQEESWIMLATNSKKQRAEVKLSELSPSERAEFETAKMSEVQNWIQTGTLTKVLKNQIPQDQILKCRWILTLKPLDTIGDHTDNPMAESQSKESHKLGYLDPKIEEIRRDSPTLNRTSKMILLQVISSMGWGLESFNIKAAFLQGQPQSDRVMPST